VSDLQLRRIDWEFDHETTPFQWNPANPDYGLMANLISFFAPAFERYIVSVVREVKPQIRDDAVREEAELFLRQEGLHARAHRNHTGSLIAKYPGLQETMDAANESYDRLRASKPLEYHLAYIANIEATFTPMFRMMLDNEKSLFAGGDDRVASLFIWHFAEEIEHRSSALNVYHAVVPGDMYRLRQWGSVFAHIRQLSDTIFDGFNRHVPVADRIIDAPTASEQSWTERLRGLVPRRHASRTGAYRDVPARELLQMSVGLLASQMPKHSPEHSRLPALAGQWFEAYERGVDVTRWYGSQPLTPMT
jgi:predicted metal-dependent hydrolase